MQIDLIRPGTGAAETELDLRLPEPGRLAPAVPTKTVVERAPEAAVPAAVAPIEATPWLDPRLGSATIGHPSQYLPMLMTLHDSLTGRQDAIAVKASAAILEEVRNHLVLNGHLNSLIG
jgi:hypothetical protein